MQRVAPLLFLVVAFSCSKSSLPKSFYYGVIIDGENRYRFGLDNRQKEPVLTIISFRGYEVPLKKFAFNKDSLFFTRADANGFYKGKFDARQNQIVGEWTSDDTVKFQLTFSEASPDTIKRLNPRTTPTSAYSPPPAESDLINVCHIKDVDMNEQKINTLIDALTKKKFGYVHSLLLARNNCLAVEEYFFEFKRDEHFGIQSVTKSFVSALTGVAISKGELGGVNIPLCDFKSSFNELVCNDQNKNLTLHDFMNMSTGLTWDEVTHDYGHEKNSSMIASETNDPFRYLFSQPRSREKIFAYNSYNHTAMSRVLKHATGLTNSEEYKQRILQPLAITNFDLGEEENGIVGDIFLRPRDMLKFGLLYLNDGQFNGKQVVPAAWVKESTTPKIEIEPGLGYGYFWWTKTFKHKDGFVNSFFAWGYGGQFIFVVPELKLVVVLNGTNWSTDPKKYYFEMMEQFILPAIE